MSLDPMSNTETAWTTLSQWRSYARRLERRHLSQYGISWSATTIAQRARTSIVEIHAERIRVHAGWRLVMQHAAEETHPMPERS